MHIATDYQWCGSFEDCLSLWFTFLNLEHALGSACLLSHHRGNNASCTGNCRRWSYFPFQPKSSTRISNAGLDFSNLKHLWRRHDTSLSLYYRVYNTTMRPVLQYGCETCLPPLAVGAMRQKQKCAAECLVPCWEGPYEKIISDGFSCFETSCRAYAGSRVVPPEVGWEKTNEDQGMDKSRLKKLTTCLSRVGSLRLSGRVSKDQEDLWVFLFMDISWNRNQWLECFRFYINRQEWQDKMSLQQNYKKFLLVCFFAIFPIVSLWHYTHLPPEN